MDELEDREGEIVLPRFEFDVGFGANDPLAEMGMPVAFDERRANFDGIAPLDEVGENPYVDEAVHDACVSVDEEGTEAAAASRVAIGGDGGRVLDFRMVVDRPFPFPSRDRVTGAILFLGRVVGLEGE